MPGLKYPLQEENKFLQSKIVFSIFEVDPPAFKGGKGLINTIQDAWKATGGDVQVGGNGNSSSVEDVSVSAMKVTPIGNGQVSLYLPIAYQVNESLNYENVNLNASGAAALGGLNAGSGALGAALRGVFEGVQSVGSLFGEGTAGLGARLAAERLAKSPAGFLVPEGVRNAVGLAARVTVNPNIRTAFRGVNIREFSFQFKFLPKSPEESLQVKQIINLLRRHAFPEEIRAVAGSVPLGYKYPDLFKIRLLSGKPGEFKNVGTPIKMSQLRNITTVYNPTTTALHPDGSPTEIDLTLGFIEYKTISRQDIDNEDTDNFYEYYGKNPTFETRGGGGGR
jgi:hypothetical protein